VGSFATHAPHILRGYFCCLVYQADVEGTPGKRGENVGEYRDCEIPPYTI
jgi:hypothetical protein